MTRVSAAVTFQVPLPLRELSPNGREHWATKGHATADYREYVGWEAQQARKRARIKELPKARISLVFAIKGGKGVAYCPRDIGNGIAAFKSGFDGIVDAGWMKDDSGRYMELGRIEIDSKRGPYVEVTIEEVRPCA